MWIEIVGAVLVWLFGVMTVALFLRIGVVEQKHDRLLQRYQALMADHARLLKEYHVPVEK